MVIKQGTEGDYFYVVVAGKCVVTRETPLNKEGIKLAELGPGDSFGEEALIAEAKRNATVTMSTDGTLMRLGKNDFQTLLNEPLLQWVEPRQGQGNRRRRRQMAGRAAAQRISEFPHRRRGQYPAVFHSSEAQRARTRTPRTSCAAIPGRRSSAAAYILSERGFEAYVLKGGLAATEAARSGRG